MLNEKIGFDIGWDYFSFGMSLPGFLAESEFGLMLRGFSAAKNRRVSQADANRFVRKWLLLRSNAWRRNRVFDSAVTPDFLRYIDVPECPVTEIALTYGTGGPSDWSVDRVNNNAGYSPGNLIIVSALANENKSNFSYEEIKRLALNKDVPLPERQHTMRALTRDEWMRWAAICSHVIVMPDEKIGFDIFPCVAHIPRNIPMNSSAGLQMAIGLFVSRVDSSPLNAILAGIPKVKRRQLREVLSRAQKLSYISSIHGLWLCERLFREFEAFYRGLTKDEEGLVRKLVVRTMCRKMSLDIDMESWATGSDGYLRCGN